MHVHILGICGTFMGGIAAIARAAGHRVTGSDRNVYPPMSTQLAQLGIEVTEGFEAAQLDPAPDVVVIGNVMTRGVPVIEALLDRGWGKPSQHIELDAGDELVKRMNEAAKKLAGDAG